MAAHQSPLSLRFFRQEHWSGLPFPSPMNESEKWKWSCSVAFDSSMGFTRQEYWSGLPLPSPNVVLKVFLNVKALFRLFFTQQGFMKDGRRIFAFWSVGRFCVRVKVIEILSFGQLKQSEWKHEFGSRKLVGTSGKSIWLELLFWELELGYKCGNAALCQLTEDFDY